MEEYRPDPLTPAPEQPQSAGEPQASGQPQPPVPDPPAPPRFGYNPTPHRLPHAFFRGAPVPPTFYPPAAPGYGAGPGSQTGQTALPVGFCPPPFEEEALTQDEQPLSVVAGRALTLAQIKRLQGAARKSAGLFFGAFVALLAFLGLAAYGGISVSGNIAAGSITFLTGVASLAVGGVGMMLRNGRNDRDDTNLWAAKQYVQGERHVLLLYGDRAEDRTSHGGTVIHFADAVFHEMPDMLLLQDENGRIVWRAEDLTEYDARFILEQIYRRIPDKRRRFSGFFQARLLQPLELPRIQRTETVVAQVQYTEKKERGFWGKVGHMLPFLVPLGIIPGLLLASVVYLTNSIYLDMLLFCLMTFAGVFVLALLFLLLVPEKGEQAVEIRFTRTGMEVRARGDLRYFPAQAVQRRRDGKDLVLAVPGEEFVIPWPAIDGNTALLELMGIG